MFLKRRAKLPLTIDPQDATAIAHENEVLAREDHEAHLGAEYTLPTEIGFQAMNSDLSDGWTAQMPNVVRGPASSSVGPLRITGLTTPQPEKDRD
jgi:hypothetical protein